MGLEFKVKILLHGFREVKSQWEVGEVGRWERQESGEVRSWEVPGFIQVWGIKGDSKILSFCF